MLIIKRQCLFIVLIFLFVCVSVHAQENQSVIPEHKKDALIESVYDDQERERKVEYIVKIATEYRNAGKFEEAQQHLEKALDEFPREEYQEKLKIELADVHFLWADNLTEKYDHTNAIKHYEMAYVIDKIYRPKNAGDELNAIGFLYNTLGQNQKALEYFERGLEIAEPLGDVSLESVI